MAEVKLVGFWIYSEGAISRTYWWIGCERKGIKVDSRFLVHGKSRKWIHIHRGGDDWERSRGVLWGAGRVVRSLIVDPLHVRCLLEPLGMSVGWCLGDSGRFGIEDGV